MSLRDSIASTLVPFLAGRIAYRLQWSIALALDADWALLREGIKARMPGVGTPQALGYIGADRLIDRGPSEPAANYATRLSGAFDTWRGAGNPHKLLEQLRAYFLPDPHAIRVVSNASVWHEIDPTTEEITRTKASNWIWDAFTATPRWWRGWVVIDSSAGPWTQWFIGDPDVFLGDGHTLGSTATVSQVLDVKRIVRRWKPQHVHAMHIIVTFDASLFQASDAPGAPMPSGDYADSDNRSPDAAYWGGVI
jgi:hypothetical protein